MTDKIKSGVILKKIDLYGPKHPIRDERGPSKTSQGTQLGYFIARHFCRNYA